MGLAVGDCNLIFYADDGKIAGQDHVWVQDAMSVTVAIFRRMGLETNMEKTNTMVCTPRFIWGEWGDHAYKQQAMREGDTFRERKRLRVSFSKCRVMIAQYYLNQHMLSQNGICVPHTRVVSEKGEGRTTYVVSLPRVLQLIICPVPGCPTICYSAGRLREHFMFRNFRSRIAVVQYGRYLLTRCNMCGIHMPAGRLVRHTRTEICERKTHIILMRWDAEIAAKCVGETFSLAGDDGVECFEDVDFFNYLGRVLHRTDKNWPEVFRNIGRPIQVWERLGKLMRREGSDTIVAASFYQAVVQAVLLFGA